MPDLNKKEKSNSTSVVHVSNNKESFSYFAESLANCTYNLSELVLHPVSVRALKCIKTYLRFTIQEERLANGARNFTSPEP